MKINVSQLLKEASGSRREYAADEDLESGEGQVAGSIKLMRTDKCVWVSAEVSSEAKCTCSRCLKEFSQQIGLAFEEEAFYLSDGASACSTEIPVIDDKSILDLTETLEQYLYLAIPIKPICREDCRGICSQCGVDLNDAECVCDHDQRNSSWAKLLQIAVSDEPGFGVN